MDRRQQAEDNYRQKFEALGYSERFDFIRREWSKKPDRRFWCRCKTCGTKFILWNDSLRGKQSHILCPECGAASDGNDVWERSLKCAEAMAYYVQGHTVRNTAEKFGVSKSQINNSVKKRGLTNGIIFPKPLPEGEKKKDCNGDHRHRAKRYGCAYDPSVTLKKLIERDGLRCALCGGLCDPDDKGWSEYFGPTAPTIDHIIPMSKGGGHTWGNVQVAHAICNCCKGDSYDESGENVFDRIEGHTAAGYHAG